MISTAATLALYVFIYGVSGSIFLAANNSTSNLSKKRLIALGIVFLACFAGMRGTSVGTDTAETLIQYYTNQIGRKIEIGGVKVIIVGNYFYYIVSNALHFLHLGEKTFLFLMELLTLAPVGVVAYKKRNSIPIHITMLLLVILYFQVGFNWIRQSAANGFVLLSMVNAEEKSIKRAVVLAIIAILIHSSAIIGIAFLLFTYTFMRIKNKYLKTVFGAVFMVLFLFLITRWDTILSYGLKYGVLQEKYAGYIRVFTGQTSVDRWFIIGRSTYVDYLIRLVIVILPFVFLRKDINEEERKNVNYYKMLSVLGLIAYSYVFFSMHSAYGNRVSYSFEYVQVLNLGLCCTVAKQKGSVPLRNIAIFGVAILYNIWLYYVMGWHATVPFVFGF